MVVISKLKNISTKMHANQSCSIRPCSERKAVGRCFDDRYTGKARRLPIDHQGRFQRLILEVAAARESSRLLRIVQGCAQGGCDSRICPCTSEAAEPDEQHLGIVTTDTAASAVRRVECGLCVGGFKKMKANSKFYKPFGRIKHKIEGAGFLRTAGLLQISVAGRTAAG